MTRVRPHSKRYLRKIMTLTVSILVALCILVSYILYINANNATQNAIFATESERTTELLKQADGLLTNLMSRSISFSNVYFPIDEITDPDNYLPRKLYMLMVDTSVDSDTYTKNIEISIHGKSLEPSPVNHQRHWGKLSFLSIWTEEKIAWPYYFDLKHIGQNGIVHVTTTVSAYYLSERLFSFRDNSRAEYLLLEDGTILLSNQRPTFFQNIADICPGLIELDTVENERFGSYGDCYYTISSPNKHGLRIVSLLDRSMCRSQYLAAEQRTIFFSLLILLAAVLISCLLSFLFYRPVNQISVLLQTYIPDDIKNYENEISFINHSISKYVSKGAKLKDALPKTISKLKEAQAAVLQHQISSHFLYNTLENIRAISIEELGLDNDIEHSIICLNSIIQESIQYRKAFVPLCHEISLAKNYVSLMQTRFPGVRVDWDIDETLLSCIVYKFSLQPVLENCFIHAFKNNSDFDSRITVSVIQKEENFVIRVCDNGCGIEEGILNNLRAILDAQSETPSSKHIGIWNVQNRIQAVFGKNYGIHIESSQEKTVVDICYPINHDQKPT